jgi:rod shape-determining protein MreD
VRPVLLGPVARLVPVGMVVVALQRTVCASHPVAGVVLQVVLALAVGAGAGGGPERGALAGFVLGMMYDLGVGTPLGISALAYGLGGATAGYITLVVTEPHWWVSAPFAGLGAAVGEASVAGITFLIDERRWGLVDLGRVVGVVAAFAMVTSPVLVPVGRWCMGVKRPKWKAIPE